MYIADVNNRTNSWPFYRQSIDYEQRGLRRSPKANVLADPEA